MKRLASLLLGILTAGIITCATAFLTSRYIIQGCAHVHSGYATFYNLIAVVGVFTGGLASGLTQPFSKKPNLISLICSPGIWCSALLLCIFDFDLIIPLVLIPTAWLGCRLGMRTNLTKVLTVVIAQGLLLVICFLSFNSFRAITARFSYTTGEGINKSDKKGRTVLMDECMAIASPKVINTLIKLGADVHQKDNGGNTALHYACSHNPNINAVRKLIELGAKVDAKDDDGETALFSASRSGSPEIVDLLVQNGLSVNAKNKDGSTPLMHACSSSKSARTTEILIHHGADVNAKDKSGDTPLILAIDNYRDKKETVDLLIEHGADINAGNTNGVTPFAQAVLSILDYGLETEETGQAPIIGQLAKLGVDVNAKPYGSPLLFFFIDLGKTNEIELLLDLGADINATNNKGKSALISLMSQLSDCGPSVDPETVKFILEKGIDPCVADHSGKTAIDYLKERTDHGIDYKDTEFYQMIKMHNQHVEPTPNGPE